MMQYNITYILYLIASRIPPGRIDWVVGGRVVFFVFVVFSVFPVFALNPATKQPKNTITQQPHQTNFPAKKANKKHQKILEN